jgi:hypothetical protein
MLQSPGEEAFALISNVPKKGVALNHLPLSPLAKMNENPTKKLRSYDKGN